MDKSRNKLKIYHVPADEPEIYKQNKKHRYLQQYLDMAGNPEDLSADSIYDPEGLDDFFMMHESVKLRESEKSRRISLKNNLAVKFQAMSLLLVFIVIISGSIIMRFHQAGAGHAHDIQAMRAEEPSLYEPLEPVEFNPEIYNYINNAFHRTIETLNQNTGGNAGEAKVRELVAKFNMLYINQHEAGMPNGCEIVSLAMLVSRDYRAVSVQDISAQYLDKRPLMYTGGMRFGDDPTYYYIGDPEGTGYGIFAPGLAAAANKLLQSRDINKTAYDISGCSDEELFGQASGAPVIIWYTHELNPVRWGQVWRLPDGSVYSYPLNQHCAVLADYTETTVILYDPIYGVVEYERELFLRRWSETGPFRDRTRQAVVIR